MWKIKGKIVSLAKFFLILMLASTTTFSYYSVEVSYGARALKIQPVKATDKLVPLLDTFTTVMESNTTDWDVGGLGDPFVTYDAGLYKMWYTAVSIVPAPTGGRVLIAYAESYDGITWLNKQVVHDPGFGYFKAYSPWVMKEGGTYRMWHADYYEWVAGDWSSYIAYMTSTDGITWPAFMSADDQNVSSAQGQSNPQGDGYCAAAPCVVYEPSIGYVMWYSVLDHPQPGMGGPSKIWRATSDDGITWSNRQLTLPYVNNTWEGFVGSASVVKEDDGSYTMFYGAANYNGISPSGDYILNNTSIGMAESIDGVSWTDRTQILKPSDLGVNITSIGQPFHFQDVDGKRYLYFSYYDKGDGKSKLGRIQLGPPVPYDVTVEAHCDSEGLDVNVNITMDDSPTGYTTPHTFTNLTETHTFTVPDYDANGHPFKQWNIGETSTTITVTSAGTYTAYYAAKYNLTIATTPEGTTNPLPGNYTYWDGTVVNVTAQPSLGYVLDHWELDTGDAGSLNPIMVVMNASHTLQPVFSWVGICNLTITTTTGGTTFPDPGTYEYTNGTAVEVEAFPDTGYGFDHWELDGSWNYSNPITVTMNSDHVLHAVFNYSVTIEAHCYTEDADVNLNITMDGSPTDYVTPYTFSVTEPHNFTVPDVDLNGHFFKQWDTGETSTTIEITSPGTYRAYYQARYNLTITTTVGGTTNPAPDNYTYWDGTEVSVNATPSLGYVLDRWELDTANVGNPNPISVTMNSSHTLNSVFSWVGICNLTISTTAGGTTSPTPGIYSYTNGTSAEVTATPDIGYGFDHWDLDGSWNYSNPITVTMDSDHTLVAFFKLTHTLTITINMGGTGGTTNPSPGPHTYFEGTAVTVTATAYTDFSFGHWELDGSWNYSNPITVTMDSDHVLHAVFTFDVTITAYCFTERAAVGVAISMDGSPTGYVTPHTFTNLSETHRFTIPVTDAAGHAFLYWNIGEVKTTITVAQGGTHTAHYTATGVGTGVGGVEVPVDKFGLLAPYIGLALTILVGTVATAVYAKRLKRRKEKQ